ncbi:ABC-F family ATP-binding cassette domain-containing protein [Orenia marismortui]|uniref:ATP-binding cassette subfamily F protein 3 n=1 Tax=Orenia marismortui TaxID=46469 RepID=A0A4R8HQM4_9FIRM|nr:ABC-F family ATP-binding cassette domain-containing protein [Orenia marismortui]TDX59033.1 ATP-binding cassette subfamily F protein 3 [Orenia marismortui]
MGLLRLSGASKYYPEKVIFEDISLQIAKKDRVGLIGVNGTGKSTLMKIFIGQEYLDDGELLSSNDLDIGYLAQDFGLQLDNPLYEEMLTVFKDVFRLEEKLRDLELEMSKTQDLEKVMNRYSRLREEYEKSGGYQIESRIKGVLKGLGFSENYFTSKLSNFSGGEKTRAALAKLLLQEPELLLLDEPTNHLDLESKEWLEDYLISYPGAMVIISHDRYFLDKVVNRVWELEKGRLEKYQGNYSFYLKEKPQRLLTWQREYEKQQEKIEKTEAYIRKYKAGIKSKQARGRQKQLDRMEIIPKPPTLSKAKIKFNSETVSGEEVLEVDSLVKYYEDDLIFRDVNFKIYRGEKIALVGSNGSGKSTLFKVLLDKIDHKAGKIKFGTKVKVGYFSQEHEELSLEYNLIEEMMKVKDVTKSQARDILARFLFKGDDVLRKVGTLSGGEKGRLALAKLSVQDFNLLLLDEPTNHLDIQSKELLEEALKEFPGTILMISHDRYFLDKLINKVFALQEKTLLEYLGNYSSYRKQYLKVLEEKAIKEKVKKDKIIKNTVNEKKKKLDLEKLEEDIMNLETKVLDMEKKFNLEEFCMDSDKLAELTEEYQNAKKELEEYYIIWEEAI